MKFKIFTSALLVMAVIGCSKKEDNKKPIETAAPEAAAMVNGKACYVYTKSKDTVSLSLAMNSNNANGELIYNLEGKDKNSGTFSGTFIGDTLYADYTFMSEGTSSVREAVFLRNGDVLTQGYGDMEEKNNKQCFKDPKKLQFSSNGIVLVKTDCK